MDPKDVLRPTTPEEIKVKDVDYKYVMKMLHPETLKSVPRWNWDSLFALMGELQPK